MLRKLFKLVLGAAVGTAAALYFTSDQGRRTLGRGLDLLEEVTGLDVRGALAPLGSCCDAETDVDKEAAIEAKIEETRQRLHHQMDEAADTTGAESSR